MNAAEISADYAEALQETIIVRRYAGVGPNRPRFDVSVRGRAVRYGADELLGGILQGDYRVIVLQADLIAHQIALPIITDDKAVVAGRELAIMSISERKSLDGTIVALELRCRG
jgi:hypothetical protein